MCLVSAFFPAESPDKQKAMVDRLLHSGSGKKLVKAAGLRDALNLLQESTDADKFVDLMEQVSQEERETLIKERIGAPHEKAAQWTPQALKDLRPPVSGAVLCYQLSSSCFEGYFPKPADKRGKGPKSKKHWSIARSHVQVRSQFAALQQVVKFLWAHYGKSGGVPGSGHIRNNCRASALRVKFSQTLAALLPALFSGYFQAAQHTDHQIRS